jgi:hypothetical protein
VFLAAFDLGMLSHQVESRAGRDLVSPTGDRDWCKGRGGEAQSQ